MKANVKLAQKRREEIRANASKNNQKKKALKTATTALDIVGRYLVVKTAFDTIFGKRKAVRVATKRSK